MSRYRYEDRLTQSSGHRAGQPARRLDESQGSLEQVRLRAYVRQRLADEDPLLGVLGGLVAAAGGAVLWTVLTLAAGQSIGWMAVVIGVLVGYAVRILGKGVSPTFGLIGAALALLGCLFGRLLIACARVAKEKSASLTDVLADLDPAAVIQLLAKTFTITDLLFYGLAVYVAYQHSFVALSAEDVPLPHGTTAE